jgi:hypothetical protein
LSYDLSTTSIEIIDSENLVALNLFKGIYKPEKLIMKISLNNPIILNSLYRKNVATQFASFSREIMEFDAGGVQEGQDNCEGMEYVREVKHKIEDLINFDINKEFHALLAKGMVKDTQFFSTFKKYMWRNTMLLIPKLYFKELELRIDDIAQVYF